MGRIPIEQEFAALLRSDLHGFIERSFYELNPTTEFRDNWHIHVIAHELEQVRLGNSTRLIINVPPRSLKSHCASVAFPGWVLGHEPSSQIICASYAQGLSNKLASDCRTLMMKSDGGVGSAAMLANRPIQTVMSGPVAGVIGSRYVGDLKNIQNLISFDVGGTRTRRDQAKIGLRDGERGPRIVRGGRIDDRKPDPLSFEADQRPLYLGRIGDPNDPRKGIAAPLLPF